MELIVDTSVLMAVVLNEPEKDSLIKATKEHEIVGPSSICCEIGNAFSAMMRRKRLGLTDALKGYELFEKIPIRYLEVNMHRALKIAAENNIYAYDAYFIECALHYGYPLISLDEELICCSKKYRISMITI